MKDLFTKYKILEQSDIKDREIDLLRDALMDVKQYFDNIVRLKGRFVSSGQYHHVLKTWEKDLDAIFEVAERYMRCQQVES